MTTNTNAALVDYADAYQGAREDLAIWKRRALEAESALRTEQKASSRLAAEVNEANGPTHLGEPVQPERVTLTDLQIDEFLPLVVAGYSALIGDDEIRAFARAVEATHGIKPAKGHKP